jgi:hypothetical protein
MHTKKTFTIPENSKTLHSFKKRGKVVKFVEDSEDSWWVYVLNYRNSVLGETYMITQKDLSTWLSQLEREKWSRL